MIESYVPISCGLYDRLELCAVRAQQCDLLYHESPGTLVRARDRIETLFVREGVEYLRLCGGLVIRLDMLVELNGVPADAGDT